MSVRTWCVPVPYQGLVNFVVNAATREEAAAAAVEAFKSDAVATVCGNEFELPLEPRLEGITEFLQELLRLEIEAPGELAAARHLLEVVVLAHPGCELRQPEANALAVCGPAAMKAGVSALAARLLSALNPKDA
jgi:hypothetical protein